MQQNVTEAMYLLGIKTAPFSSLELKTNYAALSKVVSKREKLMAVAAYKLLLPKAVDKLELQLLPGQTTKACPTCSGLSGLRKSIWKESSCENCGDTKKVALACRYCEGGKYKQKSGLIAPCRACNGTGIWRVVNCKKCAADGLVKDFFSRVGQYVEAYTPCDTCNGSGKLAVVLFNPVISETNEVIIAAGFNKL